MYTVGLQCTCSRQTTNSEGPLFSGRNLGSSSNYVCLMNNVQITIEFFMLFFFFLAKICISSVNDVRGKLPMGNYLVIIYMLQIDAKGGKMLKLKCSLL